jgi:S-adenosylmethionine:tRNA ribosyltransferase-isomerase
MAAFKTRGITWTTVTLHVGPGTFLPVHADDTESHKMHAEHAVLSPATAEALNAVHARGGRVVAVGSTALRTVESAADDSGVIRPFAEDTSLFITPGYRFKAVDAMLTNFHLPRSTLFMLVSAFCGRDTYGDASLLVRAT